MFAALYISNAGQLDIDILHLQQECTDVHRVFCGPMH